MLASKSAAQSGKLVPSPRFNSLVAHGYHGISLIRQLLGIQFENAAIRASERRTPLVVGTIKDGNHLPVSRSSRPGK